MTEKVVKNRATKVKALAEQSKGELLPPLLGDAQIAPPTALNTVRDIREEMARIYKLVFKGKVALSDATRLVYYLDRMIQAIKTETELDTIASAYAKAWGGVSIITDEDVIDA